MHCLEPLEARLWLLLGLAVPLRCGRCQALQLHTAAVAAAAGV